MNILLVNDDGYLSSNLELLKKELENYGDVYVVAPEVSMSGKSIALTIFSSIKVRKHNDRLYSVDGTPADCVCFGLNSLGIKFDLVCSGINFGHNITYDVMHSGTIGACVESLMYDTPAIAFSSETNHEENAKYIKNAMDYILKNKLLSLEYFLNVNFPKSGICNGIVFSTLEYRRDNRYFEFDGEIATPRRTVDDYNLYPKNSDVYLVENDYISITPLMRSLFSKDLYKRVKKDKNL
jgi:5'-nucleotidase